MISDSQEEADYAGPEYEPHAETFYTSKVNVKPPKDFDPKKLNENELKERPPSSYIAQRLFFCIDVFKNVDSHAGQVQ